MLSAQAYSFQQKSKLAISLSWISGYTNVAGDDGEALAARAMGRRIEVQDADTTSANRW